MSLNSDIEKAVALLRQGDVVALPTETVYGLAADIHQPEALKKIFSVKSRPFFDPLIVHVSSESQAQTLSGNWTSLHHFLAENFWPGPLSLIAQKSDKVDPLITSGLDTVALRFPQHPVFQAVLQKLGSSLAAPSANRFGKTSPTQASHVEKEFNGRVFVVDGGASEIGIESTVVYPQKTQNGFLLEILRPGGITEEKLKSILQNFPSPVQIQRQEKQNSPGHLKHHYQPDKPLYILEEPVSSVEKTLASLGLSPDQAAEMKLADEPTLAARQLYEQMRELAESSAQALYVVKKPGQHGELWEAIWDRLRKAASNG